MPSFIVSTAEEVNTVAAGHIAHHDPARVLRDVEAKRALLAGHAELYRDISWLEDGDEAAAELPVCGKCVPKHSSFADRGSVPLWPCEHVRLLALPYSDHPDYRQEWAPRRPKTVIPRR